MCKVNRRNWKWCLKFFIFGVKVFIICMVFILILNGDLIGNGIVYCYIFCYWKIVWYLMWVVVMVIICGVCWVKGCSKCLVLIFLSCFWFSLKWYVNCWVMINVFIFCYLVLNRCWSLMFLILCLVWVCFIIVVYYLIICCNWKISWLLVVNWFWKF